MNLKLTDFCPGGWGISDNDNTVKLCTILRKGIVSGTISISLSGMKFTGSQLLNETIGVLVGEMGEETVRRYVKFPDANEFDQKLIDTVLTNATEYFKKQTLEAL
jgi:hypothetical protein